MKPYGFTHLEQCFGPEYENCATKTDKIKSQKWIFGMIEEEDDGDVVLYSVKDRKTLILKQLIINYIIQVTEVDIDGRKAQGIDWKGMNITRLEHVHDC